jgi:hypothetical protein
MLSDTIVERHIGEIINEGTGEGFTEVQFMANYNRKKNEIQDLLLALGISDCSEIFVEERVNLFINILVNIKKVVKF